MSGTVSQTRPRSAERAGQEVIASGPVTGISAAAVARSRTLGEARWSPGGTHLAWLDAFGGRVDLVVGRAYGGGGYCWVDDDTLVYAAADGRLLAIAATGGPLRVLSRDGRAAAPAAS